MYRYLILVEFVICRLQCVVGCRGTGAILQVTAALQEVGVVAQDSQLYLDLAVDLYMCCVSYVEAPHPGHSSTASFRALAV